MELGTVRSVAGKTGEVTLTAKDVGLGQVNNTADRDKPVSAAVQAALEAKLSRSRRVETGTGLIGGGASGRAVPYKIGRRREGDVARSLAAVDKAERLLGWKAKHDITDMCKTTWNWQSSNPNGYTQN